MSCIKRHGVDCDCCSKIEENPLVAPSKPDLQEGGEYILTREKFGEITLKELNEKSKMYNKQS